MCDPLTIAAVGFSAFSSISQANAQAASVKAQADATQKVNEYNAKTNDMLALDSQNRGAGDAARIRQNAKAANASLRTVVGSTGFLADSGTSLDLQTQNAGVGAFDSLQTINNAEREAYGYKSTATNLRFQGDLAVSEANRQAKSIKQQGLLSAAGTLVTGAANKSNMFQPNQAQRYTSINGGSDYITWNTDRSGRRF